MRASMMATTLVLMTTVALPDGEASEHDPPAVSDSDAAKQQPAPSNESAPDKAKEPPSRAKQQPTTKAAEPSRPARKHSQVPADDEALIVGLLAKVGAEDATLRVVERTAARQARVMYDLATNDLQHARDMYCSAGDAVLDVFDPKRSQADNLARMQAELLSQLPTARELGCLNHIENADVYAVDVAAEQIPESKYQTLIDGANAAVDAGKLARFLYPPRHPGAFHFELARAVASEDDAAEKPANDAAKPSQ